MNCSDKRNELGLPKIVCNTLIIYYILSPSPKNGTVDAMKLKTDPKSEKEKKCC